MPSTLVLVLSDLHFGKRTPTFDLKMARRRIEGLKLKLLEHPGYKQPDEIAVALIGDVVEGEGIYPAQATHIEAPTLRQKEVAYEALAVAFEGLSSLAPVTVYTVWGNHGRQSREANEQTNWDCAVYQQLATHFRDDERVSVLADPQ